jgi:hypothetical protein
MAKRTSKKPIQAPKSGSRIWQIQQAINEDFVVLAKDYKKLFVALWDIPTTRFFVGGVAFAAVVPWSLKGLSWVSDTVNDKIEERKFTGKLENLKKHFGHVGDEIAT